MTIYTRSETYVHRIKILDRSNDVVYPSEVTFYLYNECGILMNAGGTSMATDTDDPYYECTYDIPADALYGEYSIKVVATDADDVVTNFDDHMYIFPWNIIHDVRKYSGITAKKSLDDHDMAAIIFEAYREALDEVYEFRHDETPNCNPDDGTWFNGTNKIFETKHGPIADKNGDGVINGWGEASCGTDINGWWKDSDGDCHQLKITVNEAHCGNITIEQIDGTAIPSDCQWVKLEYHTEWETYNERIFRFAVAYLAAHKAVEAFKALDKATLADLHSNAKDVYLHKNRMLKQYKKAMRKIKKPLMGAGMLPGT